MGSLLTEWRLGTVPNVGNFNLSGSPGIGLPPDPDGVGGVIDFYAFLTVQWLLRELGRLNPQLFENLQLSLALGWRPFSF